MRFLQFSSTSIPQAPFYPLTGKSRKPCQFCQIQTGKIGSIFSEELSLLLVLERSSREVIIQLMNVLSIIWRLAPHPTGPRNIKRTRFLLAIYGVQPIQEIYSIGPNQETQPLILELQTMKYLLRKPALLPPLGSLTVKPGCPHLQTCEISFTAHCNGRFHPTMICEYFSSNLCILKR